METLDLEENSGFLSGWFHWCPTSMKALRDAESRILSHLKTSFRSRYVNIDSKGEHGQLSRIWTLSMNDNSTNIPLVLVHGFGSGVALWALNLDAFAKNRPVYAFDMLGFGRSSRPRFSEDPLEAESQLVQSIEEWRKSIGLKSFILLGHSMGGFLAASYTLKYPAHVDHLVLADPWGFQETPDVTHIHIPLWAKAVITLLQPFNPLAGLRAAGPLGPRLVARMRPDLKKKFSTVIEDIDAIPAYIYHCNAQTPSGETAFKSMTSGIGWAKHPMIRRIGDIPKEVPMTFIYGEKSWIDKRPGRKAKSIRKDSYVDYFIIQRAGHHIYADQVDTFNKLVQHICSGVDGESTEFPMPSKDDVIRLSTTSLKDDKTSPSSSL